MRNRMTIVQTHPLATFFGLTFFFSWFTWPILGDQYPTGPLLAALIVVPIIGGRAGLRSWVRRIRALAGRHGRWVDRLLLYWTSEPRKADALRVLLYAPRSSMRRDGTSTIR